MKIRSFVVAAIVLGSASVVAAEALHGTDLLRPSSVARETESRHRDEVIAMRDGVAADAEDHHHVDLRSPGNRAPLGTRPATLSDVAATAAELLHGEATSAVLNTTADGSSRYDVDVRVADGRVARLTIDSSTRQIGWRTPPVRYE